MQIPQLVGLKLWTRNYCASAHQFQLDKLEMLTMMKDLESFKTKRNDSNRT